MFDLHGCGLGLESDAISMLFAPTMTAGALAGKHMRRSNRREP
jgi:hypothetical protein